MIRGPGFTLFFKFYDDWTVMSANIIFNIVLGVILYTVRTIEKYESDSNHI